MDNVALILIELQKMNKSLEAISRALITLANKR